MIRLLAFVLSLFLIFGCAGSPKKKISVKRDYSKAAARYMPMQKGNRWTYLLNYMGNSGTLDVEILDEKDGFFIDNHGAALKIDGRGVRDHSRYILKFPLLSGARWSAVLSPGVIEERNLAGVDETVRTPAGTFEGALVVESRVKVGKGRMLLSRHYFVADVGIVRIETYLEEKGADAPIPQTVTALKAYTVNNNKN